MFSNANAGQMVVASECSDRAVTVLADSGRSVAPPSFNMQSSGTPQGSVAILWDIENCPVPNDVRPEDVAGNIRMALRVHPIISGAITTFSAYGDFNAFPRRVREGCQRTGVKLVDVPNGRKDAADKAILVDMFLFALDNRPPSYIMLISGDVDFAPALHILGQRGYTIILVIPSGVGVSSALSNAGRFVWDWPSVVRGEGFVPNTRPPHSGYYNAENQEEEAIIYRGLSQSVYNSRDFSVVSQSLSEYTSGNLLALPCYPGPSRSQSLQPGTSYAVTGSAVSVDQNQANWAVQPGDINGLKGQLIKLLELSGGCMTLARVPEEYQKFFGRPLSMSEYGASKLINLLKRMSDVMSIDGRGLKRFLYLRNSQMDRRGIKGKCTQENVVDPNVGCGSSDEVSDDERVVLEECNDKAGSKTSLCTPTILKREDKEKALELFKYELMEILVCYSCEISLSCFEDIYKRRYKKSVDYLKLGANDIEDLLSKMRDVVALHDDPVSKMKYFAAAGM